MGIKIQKNSAADYRQRAESLRDNGWHTMNSGGFWRHPNLGGLHNLLGAEKHNARMIKAPATTYPEKYFISQEDGVAVRDYTTTNPLD